MKKLVLLNLISFGLLFAGEINDTFTSINKIDKQNIRIEKKLDLIIMQYIKEEKSSEARKIVLDSTIDKTKDGIINGTEWLKAKTSKLLEK